MSLDELLSHKAWLQKFAERIARNHALADDLVQETWLVALQWQSSGHELARPWLAQVLRNLARMRARGEERRRERELAFVDADAPVPSPEALLRRGQTQQQLIQHVQALAEPYRATLILHYVEGLSAAEIATRLGVPSGTVRWRHKHALGLLRQSLENTESCQAGRPARRRALAPVPLLGLASSAGPARASIQPLGWLTRLLAGKSPLGVLALIGLLSLAAITWLWLSRPPARPASDADPGGTPSSDTSMQPAHLALLDGSLADLAILPGGGLPAFRSDTGHSAGERAAAITAPAGQGRSARTGGGTAPSPSWSAGDRSPIISPDDARDGDCAGPDGSARPPHCRSASRVSQPPRCAPSRLQSLMLFRLLQRKQTMSRDFKNRWLAMMMMAVVGMTTQIGCTDLAPADDQRELSGPGSPDDTAPDDCTTSTSPDGVTCTICVDPAGNTTTTCSDGDTPVECETSTQPDGTVCTTCTDPSTGITETTCYGSGDDECVSEIGPDGRRCTMCTDPSTGTVTTTCDEPVQPDSCFVDADPTGAQCVTCVDESGNTSTVCGECTTSVDPTGAVCTTCVDASGNALTACEPAVPQAICFTETDPTGAQCVTCVDENGDADTVCGNCSTELDPTGAVCTTCVDASGNALTACEPAVPQEECFTELDPTGRICITCVDENGNSTTDCDLGILPA